MSVTAVIPAYNEERTVGAVVRVVKESSLVSEVIVVNDGSADGTSQAARRAGAKVIDLPVNRGKGAAIRVAMEAGHGDVLLLLDADLVGLRGEHVEALLTPVLRGDCEMTVGVFEGGRPATDLAQAIVPGLSGQRAVKRSLLNGACDLEMSRFGVEVVLNRLTREQHARVMEVHLPDLTHRMKEEKMGLVRGFLARLKMYWEIVRHLHR